MKPPCLRAPPIPLEPCPQNGLGSPSVGFRVPKIPLSCLFAGASRLQTTLIPLWWQGQILQAICSRGSAWGWFQHRNKELPPPAPKTSPQTLETPSPSPPASPSSNKERSCERCSSFLKCRNCREGKGLCSWFSLLPLIKGSF